MGQASGCRLDQYFSCKLTFANTLEKSYEANNVATALTIAALTVPAWAQTSTPPEDDSHHPADNVKSEPVPAASAPTASQPGMNAPRGGMGGLPMMDMMKGMMNNMPMLNMMSMMEACRRRR